jgi:hypothetical protein
LMMAAAEDEPPVEVAEERTLFSDLDYLKSALPYFMQKERYRVADLRSVPGVEIHLNDELKQRLADLIPEEAMPADDVLRLSPDKEFFMEEISRSLQHDIIDSAWPTTQYLWPLHPVFEWVNDKAGLLFGRHEAPLIGVPGGLAPDEFIFILAGTIPNRKSTPVVDEWFALRYKDGRLVDEMSIDEVIRMTGYDRGDLPNRANLSQEQIKAGQALLLDAVNEARRVMERHYRQYREAIDPNINAEIDKLAALEVRHKDYVNSTYADRERKRQEELRQVEALFDEFAEWVRDTLEIEETPYIRVVGVMTGVEA